MSLKNIIFFVPATDAAVGGIKVILRHCEAINSLEDGSVRSAVFFPENVNFKVTWLDHNVTVRREDAFDRSSDLIILPEIWALSFGKKLLAAGYSYGIFVQGGYLIFKEIENSLESDARALKEIYEGAAIVLSISDDTTASLMLAFPAIGGRIFKTQYSLREDVFFPQGEKENLITYMPRRLPAHSTWVVSQLMVRGLGGWRASAMCGMSEAQVGERFRSSKIFLSFSELEGLPLPPLEAAACGNLVIGYTGGGGAEYWDPPVFREIMPGDLKRFFSTLADAMELLGSRKDGILSDSNASRAIDGLRNKFSRSAELERMKDFVKIVQAIPERT